MKYAISVVVIMATLVVNLLAVSVIGHWTRTDGQSVEQTDIQGKLSTTTPKDVEIRNNGLSTTGTCTVTVTYQNPAKVVTVVLEHGQDHKFDDPGLVKGIRWRYLTNPTMVGKLVAEATLYSIHEQS